MQELSAIVPARDKQTIIKTAISKVDSLSDENSLGFFYGMLTKSCFCDKLLMLLLSL
jgi:hypothetical protein